MSRTAWQAAVDELAKAHLGGMIDDEQWFRGMAGIFEAAYLEGDSPRAQSGFEPELEYAVEAPEGGGAIIEVAVLRA